MDATAGGRSGGTLAAASIAGLAVIVALPLAFVLLQAVFPRFNEGSFAGPFGGFAAAFSEGGLGGLILNTVALGAAVAAGTFVLALPLAMLRASGRVAGGAVWDLLFLIPFMIPPYIGALAWMLTLQPAGYATQLFGFNLSGFLFSFWGIAAVMTLHLFPVVYFALSRTLMTIGSRFADVGRVFGASGARAFRRITLPLATPGIAASLLIVFALTIEEYGTPATLGRESGFLVLVTSIEQRFSEWPIDLPGAAILSLVLVALALAAYLLQNWIATRRNYVIVAGKTGAPPAPVPLALRWRIAALGLFVTVALLAVILPVAAVTATALSRTLSGGLARRQPRPRQLPRDLLEPHRRPRRPVQFARPRHRRRARHRGARRAGGLRGGADRDARACHRRRALGAAQRAAGHGGGGRPDPRLEPVMVAGRGLQHAGGRAARLYLHHAALSGALRGRRAAPGRPVAGRRRSGLGRRQRTRPAPGAAAR